MTHAPVLCREAVDALSPRAGATYVDATFGGGGYTRAILKAAECSVIAIDRDPDAAARAKAMQAEFGPRLTFIPGRFGDLDALVPQKVDGVAFDVGVSSYQFDEAGRGFSFQQDAALDMRMERAGPTAADAVNKLSETALAELIYEYGEDDESRRIARTIVQTRAAAPIRTTAALASTVERAVGGRKGAKIHPATKTFQALRILVNDELNELARALSAAERILKPDGRLVVVSFHSLEDRMVKTFLFERAGQTGGASRHMPDLPPARASSFRLDQRRTSAPGAEEIAANPRARSASLRWAVRTQAPAWDDEIEMTLAPQARAEWSRIA